MSLGAPHLREPAQAHAVSATTLSTKLQDLTLSQDGLVPNMIAFNIGVELGQFAALALIMIASMFGVAAGRLHVAHTRQTY